MEGDTIAYFRNLWQTNISDLENQCKNWEKICVNNQIPDEVHGEIRTTIGLARLLINQKLKQFRGLIDDSEFNTGEKEITCLDLQGFWDMLYFEVEKINKGFSRLNKCKGNEWKFVEENSMKPVKKKVAVTKDTTVANKKNDSSKSRALAAKQRLAEAKKKMLTQCREPKKQDFVEIIQPNKEGFNPIQKSNSDDNENILNTIELSGKALDRESNKKLKQCLDVHDTRITPDDKNESPKDSLVLNDALKPKVFWQKSNSVSIQNKENFFPDDETFNISATQIKSKVKIETPVSGKTRRKSKEVIQLQCITRSAKKAMLAQQNAIQKS